jgi:hypothetical protein
VDPLPSRLYKYVPERFVPDVLDGRLLFRNLAYFRKSEHAAQGDEIEGIHVDDPDEAVLDNLTTGQRLRGRFPFHNYVNSERVFVFCMSLVLSDRLYDEFAPHCVVIHDVPEFIRRWQLGVRTSPLLQHGPILSDRVTYYEKNQATSLDITDPERIPFAKHQSFDYQEEFRLVCAAGRIKLERRIVNAMFNIGTEIAHARSAERIVRIRPIADIAEHVWK